jgi:hypothetical protein
MHRVLPLGFGDPRRVVLRCMLAMAAAMSGKHVAEIVRATHGDWNGVRNIPFLPGINLHAA